MDVGGFIKVALAVAGIGAVPAAVMVASGRRRPQSPAPDPDPAVEALLAVLPGANCGACGNASCFDAARAVASGAAPVDVCEAGGVRTAQAVARVLRAVRGTATEPGAVPHR